jgi:DEAD/DEAH box helicase domain-containing protein
LPGVLAAHAGGAPLTAAIYDGDTSAHRRKKIREHPPNVLITNPDMLHLAILAFHARWDRFFRELRFIVVDELHTYRGVFVPAARVRWRLLKSRMPRRLAQVILLGDVNSPRLAAELTSLPFTVIDEDGADAKRHFVFVIRQEPLHGRIFRQAGE